MKLAIGENIRNQRKAKSLTQEQLAEAMGVTVGAVSKWESGLSNPDISMLPVLADYFQISVDVLLGYQLNCSSAQRSAEKIRQLRYAKRYDEGLAEVEKALQFYPNCFDIVFQSAELCFVKGLEQPDKTVLSKALDLYNRSCALLSQNTDPDINEYIIQSHIGTIYQSMGETEYAVDHLKKYNPHGVNNGLIGLILSQSENFKSAIPYLSESFIYCLMGLFRTSIGLGNYYSNSGDNQSAIEVFLWMHKIVDSLREPDQILYLEKVDAIMFTGCAHAAADMNDIVKAEYYLRQAIECAERFDSSPDFDLSKFKFYHGKQHIISDDFGETAIKGIEKTLTADDKTGPILTDLWRKIINEK